MKKVLLLAVVALFVMMPFASFAMSTISDSDLNAITAQEGVSIYLENISVSGMTMTMSWGQSNVSSLSGTAISGFAFDAGGFIGADVTVGNVGINGLLTIDVGVNTSTANQGAAAGTGTKIPGGIALGLNNIHASIDGVTMIVKVGCSKDISNTDSVAVTTGMSGNAAVTSAAATMTMGTAFISNINTTVNGTVLISTH
jgi:hypothetical protein